MHVLVTGAGGHLGRKLFDFLENRPEFKVSGLDIRPVDHPRIHQADFGGDPVWAEYFKGVDVIVHLAGDREPAATWESSIRNNMDATLALYHHAVEQGVSRVVLASSNWVQGDKRFTNDRLDGSTPPGPVNAYGMSKLFCERTGEYFSKHKGLSVICLRIGWTQWTHGNRPGPHMAMGRWGQEMWLSDRDYLNGMLAAITARDVAFAAVNLMSNNPGMRWDINETKDRIGFEAEDGQPATLNLQIRMKSWLCKCVTFSAPRLFARVFPEW